MSPDFPATLFADQRAGSTARSLALSPYLPIANKAGLRGMRIMSAMSVMIILLAMTMMTMTTTMTTTLRAQTPEASPTSLTLSPAKASPARTLNALSSMNTGIKPGNSASLYLMAAMIEQTVSRKEIKQITTWLTADQIAPEELEKIEALTNKYQDIFEFVTRATARRDCAWGNVFSGATSGNTHPHMQSMDGISRLLALKARSEIFARKYQLALNTISQGMTLARRIAANNTYLDQKMAIKIMNDQMDQMTFLITRPDSPNLYWAFMTMPEPLIDHMACLRHERKMDLVEATLGRVFDSGQRTDLNSNQTNDKTLNQTRDQTRDQSDQLSGTAISQDALVAAIKKLSSHTYGAESTLLAAAMIGYPYAFQAELDRGTPEVAAKKIPMLTLTFKDQLSRYRARRDALHSSAFLPYTQAYAGMKEILNKDPVPLQLPLSEAPFKLLPDYASLHRRLAGLRLIEYARNVKSEQSSKPLPDYLLLDPVTHRPFKIDRATEKWTLISPPCPWLPSKDVTLIWRD